MIAEFSARTVDCNHEIFVFDGHSIIDTPNGLLEIPLSIFQAINPSVIVFVEAAADVIGERRASDTGRARPDRTAAELSLHQEVAKTRAAFLAESLGVPFRAMGADSTRDFISLLD
jgi:adenylate kinase